MTQRDLAKRLLQFTFVFFTAPFAPGGGQEIESPTLEELERRAEIVKKNFPWLSMTSTGLWLEADGIAPPEFLRGLQGATDVVFEGTDELPPEIHVVGRFPNVEEVLKQAIRQEPSLTFEADWKNRFVRFGKHLDGIGDLSEAELMGRYRLPLIDRRLIASHLGLQYPGMFAFNGTPFPQPLSFEISRDPNSNRITLLANQYPIRIFAYQNPMEIDQKVYQAGNPESFKAALKEKIDQMWTLSGRFLTEDEERRIEMLKQQLKGFLGVNTVERKENGLVITLAAAPRSQMAWEIPSPSLLLYTSEQEAYQVSLALQNRITLGISTGGMALLSDRFGLQIVQPGFQFFPKFQDIVTDPELSLREKERRIRQEWPEAAEPLLEFFYTAFPEMLSELAWRQTPAALDFPNPLEDSPQPSERSAPRPFPTPPRIPPSRGGALGILERINQIRDSEPNADRGLVSPSNP